MENSINSNFISFKDSDETCTMHTTSDNIEVMIGNKKVESLKNFLVIFCKNIKKD